VQQDIRAKIALKFSDVLQINVKIAMRQFVPHFLSYVSARYCLDWFTVRKVITKIKRVNFYLDTV